jgi:hypothetical protein
MHLLSRCKVDMHPYSLFKQVGTSRCISDVKCVRSFGNPTGSVAMRFILKLASLIVADVTPVLSSVSV